MSGSTRRTRGNAARPAFEDALRDALTGGAITKLTFGSPREGTSAKSVTARFVDVKGGRRVQIVSKLGGRDRTENVEVGRGEQGDGGAFAALVQRLAEFRNADLFTTTGTWRFEHRDGQEPVLVHTVEAREAASTAHDREKAHRIGGAEDTPWLRAFGLVTPDGKPTADGKDKLTQIRRFVEILDHLLDPVTSAGGAADRAAPLRIVDMGCGKGHLAIAAAVHLTRAGFTALDVVGVEVRPHLVESANALVKRLAIPHVRFVAGTIADAPLADADVVIALHACDTATDDALSRAIAANARLIVASPCCHKEVRPQLQAPPGLAPLVGHGILLDRQAELVTDALRAALLGSAGYDARVFEWVSTEHTGRNVMIAAHRSDRVDRDRARAAAVELAATWHIATQRLAGALNVPLKPGGSGPTSPSDGR